MSPSPFAASHPRARLRRRLGVIAVTVVLASWPLAVACTGKPADGPRDFARGLALPELDVSAQQESSDCLIETQAPHRAWGRPLALRLRADGTPFAKVFRAPARLHVRDDGVSTLLVDDGLVTLRGYADLRQVELFPRGPIQDRALYLSPLAILEPVRRSANMLELRHRIRGPLRLPGDPTQELSVVCSQLSLSQGSFDPKISAQLLGRIGYAYARSGQQLDFWAAPDVGSGMKLQVFLPAGEWIELTVHERAGAGDTERWLVSYQQGTELVAGWVLRSSLETSPQKLGVVSYAAGVRFLVPENFGARSCKRALALGVMHRGVATRVGQLRAGTTWDFADPEDAEREERFEHLGLVAIRVPHAVWLEPAPNHQLVVRASELRDCAVEPKK